MSYTDAEEASPHINYGGGRQTISIFGGYPDDTIEHPTVKRSPYKGIDNSTLPAAGVTPKLNDGSFIVAQRPGLETKLKHCLAGSNIFADVTPGVDPKHQFSPSPNGKVRDISDAKKRALAGNDIFNNNQDQDSKPQSKLHSDAKLAEMGGSDIFGGAQKNFHRACLKVRKPPGGDSSIVFGDPAEHISLKYRTSDEAPKIIG